MTSDINSKFNSKFKNTKVDLKRKRKGQPPIKQYEKFSEDCNLNTPTMKSLISKSQRSGIEFSILGEVYNRGIDSWIESDSEKDPVQYAFDRVNSFINKGKTYYNEDADLNEAKAKPYVKPFHDPHTKEQLGWKSSNGYHVKFWRNTESAKKKAMEHAGLNEEIEQYKLARFNYKTNKFELHSEYDSADDARKAARTVFGRIHGNQVRIQNPNGEKIPLNKKSYHAESINEEAADLNAEVLDEANKENKLKKDIYIVNRGKEHINKGINFARYSSNQIADTKGDDHRISYGDYGDDASEKHAMRKTNIRNLKYVGRKALANEETELEESYGKTVKTYKNVRGEKYDLYHNGNSHTLVRRKDSEKVDSWQNQITKELHKKLLKTMLPEEHIVNYEKEAEQHKKDGDIDLYHRAMERHHQHEAMKHRDKGNYREAEQHESEADLHYHKYKNPSAWYAEETLDEGYEEDLHYFNNNIDKINKEHNKKSDYHFNKAKEYSNSATLNGTYKDLGNLNKARAHKKACNLHSDAAGACVMRHHSAMYKSKEANKASETLKEEVEQIDELSKKSVSTYFSKASKSRGEAEKNNDKKTLKKRESGLDNAFKKIVSEKVETQSEKIKRLNNKTRFQIKRNNDKMVKTGNKLKKLDEVLGKENQIGLPALTKKLQKQTPGQEKAQLPFIEDVVAMDKHGVVVSSYTDQYGNVIPAKVVKKKLGRKILSTGNMHDGK